MLTDPTSIEIAAAMFGLIFYLVNLLGNITFAWVKSKLPKESVLTPDQEQWLQVLHDLHNVMDEYGQPRWWNHPKHYESQTEIIGLLQSMQHNMSTQSAYIHDAGERSVKALDQLFKIARGSDAKDREHDAEMTTSVGIILERLPPRHN
jgi:hypothetical protein